MTDVQLSWDVAAIAVAVNGQLVGESDHMVQHVVTDSRQDVAEGLFIAIVGERFDGHAYAESALEAGAVAVVVEVGAGVQATPRIEVASTGDALRALGVKRRDELAVPVIAITGSTGKTSTKDLLAAGIEGSWSSPRSFNNEIGVPLTVLGTPSDASALIVEVGSRGRGHINWLAQVVQPDVAIITNLGVVHLETFGTKAGLADAKFELVEALKPGGVAILPVSESTLVARRADQIVTFGEAGADVEVDHIETDENGLPSFTLRTPSDTYAVTLPLAGAHNAVNTAAALAAAVSIGVDARAFIERLDAVTGSAWRMEVHPGRYTVVNDAYNANPQSMASALKTVAAMGGRTFAVLGAMAELGSVCEEEHMAAGQLAQELGYEQLIVVGPDHGYAPGFGGEALKAATIEDAANTLAVIIEPGDVVLVKASRSAGLERLAHRLIEDSES
ncbi:MAG: UDP-N-acetylmuramoyl-tripeptide--D-alanyl-D-alanine ligase [Actinomycetota bacterium]